MWLKMALFHPFLWLIFIVCIYMCVYVCVCSVQFSRLVMSSSLRPHESQHARPPCPSPTSGVYPLSRWCHPANSSSVVHFSSCPESLPESGSSPMSQLFAWGGQSIGVSASASVLPMNTQDWSPLCVCVCVCVCMCVCVCVYVYVCVCVYTLHLPYPFIHRWASGCF